MRGVLGYISSLFFTSATVVVSPAHQGAKMIGKSTSAIPHIVASTNIERLKPITISCFLGIHSLDIPL
jgi:hypothetical protein